MSAEFSMQTIEDLPAAAAWVIKRMDEDRLLGLVGDLGSGKTSLVAEILKQLGSPDSVQSPTYSIINEYRDGDGVPVFHIDLYRLEQPSDLPGLGLEEMIDSGNFCFIEWPEIAEDYLPAESLYLRISAPDKMQRKLTIFRK